EEIEDRVDRALAYPRVVSVDAAHPALSRDWNEISPDLCEVTPTVAVFLLGEHPDGPTFGGLVGERSQLGRIRQFLFGDAPHRFELGRLAIAERNGAGLVEKQRIDVARRLDGAPRHGEHIETHEAIHPGNADSRKQRPE